RAAGLAVMSELGEELPHAARIVFRPAAVIGQVAGSEIMRGAPLAAKLELGSAASERSRVRRDGYARVPRTALGVDRQRTAQRVETEHRIRARYELQAFDGRRRQQVPVDHVAERFVDAHAVQEYRDALRR